MYQYRWETNIDRYLSLLLLFKCFSYWLAQRLYLFGVYGFVLGGNFIFYFTAGACASLRRWKLSEKNITEGKRFCAEFIA